MLVNSLLFLAFSFLATSFLLLAFRSTDLGSLHELRNHALLLLGVFQHHRLPHLVDFALTRGFCIFFHAQLLVGGFTLQVKLGELLVFRTHHFALTPLFESLLVVFRLVSTKIILDRACLKSQAQKRYKKYQKSPFCELKPCSLHS